MNPIPFAQYDICNMDDLFGRERIIQNLITLAKRKENTAILGLRRFGKTCLLKTICHRLEEEDGFDVYPIYMDFKTANIIGTDNTYRYMISIFTEKLFKDKIFTSPETFGTITLAPYDDWTEVFAEIEHLNGPRLQSCFNRIVDWFAEYLGKTILFIIDEYEYLFKYGFDSPTGFMRMRQMSTSILDNGQRPFAFWVSGYLSWDRLCTKLGSGETNSISSTEFVTPLTQEDHEKLWNHESQKVQDIVVRKYIKAACQYSYEKSGGVPFYAKQIGAYAANKKDLPDYLSCYAHINELLSNTLTAEQLQILKQIVLTPNKVKYTQALGELTSYGIIVKNGNGKYTIPIGFIKDYLLQQAKDEDANTIKEPESYKLVREITSLMETINKTQLNKRHTFIFKPMVDSVSTFNDLEDPCFHADQFTDFACALYRIYYEWSKKRFPRELLPDDRFRNSPFAEYVGLLRHTLGNAHQIDNFRVPFGNKTKTDMLIELTGNANEPYTSEDFQRLQIKMLRLFKSELASLLQFVRNN